MTRIAIVGAGAGGLAAARRLGEAGVDYTVFEAGSRVGGLWVYENDNGFAQAYRSLHINSESGATAFPGFPFPPGTPIYPSHSAMAAYFARFADRFDIVDRIRFSSPVRALSRAAGGWALDAGSGSETFSDVVIACGHQNLPRHPEVFKNFSGDYLHSHAYRTPDDFQGKRVLVVGVGNSALDIAADICVVTDQTYLSARSPVQILPRMVFGRPTSRLLAKVERPWVPWPVNRKAREIIGWASHGTMERWGFETPHTRTHPTSHPTVVHHMEWQRIVARPGVRSVDGATVMFADGTADEVDTVIAATGYEVDVPFLPPDVSVSQGRELDLYRRIVHPDVRGLWFLGFFNVSGGANIPVLDHQARWITAGVTSRLPTMPTPESMRAEIRAEQRRIARRYPASPRYGLELEPRRYLQRIQEEVDGRDA